MSSGTLTACECGAFCDLSTRPNEPCWGKVRKVAEDEGGSVHLCEGHAGLIDDRPYQRGSGEEGRGLEITPAMVEAGVAVLWDLEGEASKEYLAQEIFAAMCAAAYSCQEEGEA